MSAETGAGIRCANCGREVEECWICESAECGRPLCYRCVREGVESSLDPVAGPAMPN